MEHSLNSMFLFEQTLNHLSKMFNLLRHQLKWYPQMQISIPRNQHPLKRINRCQARYKQHQEPVYPHALPVTDQSIQYGLWYSQPTRPLHLYMSIMK